jgi:hypothetical protein
MSTHRACGASSNLISTTSPTGRARCLLSIYSLVSACKLFQNFVKTIVMMLFFRFLQGGKIFKNVCILALDKFGRF